MTVPNEQLTLRFARSMSELDGPSWNALAAPLDTPFFEWEWLKLLEDSGSAAPARGWYPNHLIATHGGRLIGALPMYLKWHSDGEFVFDQLWAEAAVRLGLPYYPRLVGATPFTPATGLRFLLDPEANQTRLSRRLFEAVANQDGNKMVSVKKNCLNEPASHVCQLHCFASVSYKRKRGA